MGLGRAFPLVYHAVLNEGLNLTALSFPCCKAEAVMSTSLENQME